MIKRQWKMLVALPVILLIPALLQAQTGTTRPDGAQSTTDPGSSRQGAASQSATTEPATKPGGVRKATAGDRRFLTEAAQSGLSEMESARVATEKATDPAVKQFAQRMLEDHGKANEELKRLAADKGIPLPSLLNVSEKAAIKRLQQAGGDRFDETYIKDQIVAHQKAVSLFQRYLKRGADPDLKAFAQKTLPILQEHFNLALAANKREARAGATTGREDRSGQGRPSGVPASTIQRP